MRLAVAVGVIAALAGGCRSDELTVIPTSELPADVYGPPEPTPTAELPETGTVYMIRNGRLLPVERPLAGVASSLPAALLLALLQSPADVEARTAIPPDTQANEIVLSGETATVDLSEVFDRGGSGRDRALRAAQVVYTLTEAPEVKTVSFSIDGFPIQVFDVEGNALPEPVDRADFAEFAPPGQPSGP